MRIALAIAAGLLWVGAAYAQPAQNVDNSGVVSGSSSGSSNEATPAQTPPPPASPADQAQTSNTNETTNANQTPDANHQIVCHLTTENAGSRLSRHATRVCKTREQWEVEQRQNEDNIRRMGTTQTTRG